MGKLRRPGLHLAEWARYAYERAVLMPAAGALPRSWALALADVSACIDAALPTKTSRTARREVAAAMGRRGIGAYAAVARRLAAPRRDLVMLRRFRRGREHPRDVRVHEVNGGRVSEMLAAGQPFVVCNGHFPHAPDLVISTVIIPQLAGNSLFSPIPPRRLDPARLRERLQNHLLYGLSRKLVGFPPDILIPFAGSKDAVGTMVEQLRQGGVVRLLFDAVWERPHAYRRPFAAMAERGFALGTARIARLAEVPVVFCVSVYEPDGSARIEWGPWIEPPPIDDAAAVVRVMDELIDALELAIGRYPLQYLHPIGRERVWDAEREAWIQAESPPRPRRRKSTKSM
jgi:lauroyl/myristoyl acyltransferase